MVENTFSNAESKKLEGTTNYSVWKMKMKTILNEK